MELRCPDCVSPEVEPYGEDAAETQRCLSCGSRFSRDAALITLLEAEAQSRSVTLWPVFTFDAELAVLALRNPRIVVIETISPDSHADELHRLLGNAQAVRIIKSERVHAGIYVYPLSISEPDPLLAFNPGFGPTLLGTELKLRPDEDEDSVSFTVRFLEEAVEEANALAGLGVAPVPEHARCCRQ